MSGFERDWEPDRWQEPPAVRWERADEREHAQETVRDRLTRDAGESGRPTKRPKEKAA